MAHKFQMCLPYLLNHQYYHLIHYHLLGRQYHRHYYLEHVDYHSLYHCLMHSLLHQVDFALLWFPEGQVFQLLKCYQDEVGGINFGAGIVKHIYLGFYCVKKRYVKFDEYDAPFF